MNMITRRTVRTAIGFFAVGVLALALTGPALASHVRVRTTVPSDVTLGEMVHILVALQAQDGAPLRGTTVVFYLHAVFAGVTGEVEIGRAVADETGVATLAYRPRLAGHHELRVEYLTPGETTVEAVSMTFDVTGGGQLYRSAASVEIPGVSGGALMAVLGTVWLILFGVALKLVAIARAGGVIGTPRPSGAR